AAPTALSPRVAPERLADRLEQQREHYDHTRVIVPADVDQAMAFLDLVVSTARAQDPADAGRPLWITPSGTLSPEEAHRLVTGIAREMAAGRLPRRPCSPSRPPPSTRTGCRLCSAAPTDSRGPPVGGP
ncbi:hypothetical protein, partial [Nesterenkonia sp. PF2B19]|uniref:hypothetical protein n=1 Tax=Nesterenkonia sp. PF2B19 TaxID=1881858 RepID=UPI000A2228BC